MPAASDPHDGCGGVRRRPRQGGLRRARPTHSGTDRATRQGFARSPDNHGGACWQAHAHAASRASRNPLHSAAKAASDLSEISTVQSAARAKRSRRATSSMLTRALRSRSSGETVTSAPNSSTTAATNFAAPYCRSRSRSM